MKRRYPLIVVLALVAVPGGAQDPAAATAALISRAKSLELATPYVPPPGDPLSHHAAGYAKVMCSAVFITGLDPDFAAANVGFFIAPLRRGPRSASPSSTAWLARFTSRCRTASRVWRAISATRAA